MDRQRESFANELMSQLQSQLSHEIAEFLIRRGYHLPGLTYNAWFRWGPNMVQEANATDPSSTQVQITVDTGVVAPNTPVEPVAPIVVPDEERANNVTSTNDQDRKPRKKVAICCRASAVLIEKSPETSSEDEFSSDKPENLCIKDEKRKIEKQKPQCMEGKKKKEKPKGRGKAKCISKRKTGDAKPEKENLENEKSEEHSTRGGKGKGKREKPKNPAIEEPEPDLDRPSTSRDYIPPPEK